MSYRCGFCNAQVKHGVSMKRHTLYRKVPVIPRYEPLSLVQGEPTRTEIARETPICGTCQEFFREVDRL